MSCIKFSNIELIFSELARNYGVSSWFPSRLYIEGAAGRDPQCKLLCKFKIIQTTWLFTLF